MTYYIIEKDYGEEYDDWKPIKRIGWKKFRNKFYTIEDAQFAFNYLRLIRGNKTYNMRISKVIIGMDITDIKSKTHSLGFVFPLSNYSFDELMDEAERRI